MKLEAGAHARPGFAREVQDALAHLYDPIYLQVHPLAGLLAREPWPGDDAAARGRALRQRLLEAIESLAPSSTSARESRGYQILRLRYVDGLERAAVQDQLALGKSQFYADHARALQAVISLLRTTLLSPSPSAAVAAGADSPPASNMSRADVAGAPLALTSFVAPLPLTSFVGRQRELATAVDLLRRERDPARLLTFTGPPGAGKSRLAQELVARLAPAYPPGGPRYLDLTAGDSRPAALALIASVCEAPSLPEIGLGRAQPALLVLDNCEHVLAIGSDLAALVRANPRLHVLVTSRVPLEVYGERQLPVPPLGLPRDNTRDLAEVAASEAVSLFVERAQAVQPEFRLTEHNVASIVSICRQLDGLPLAIELAAARSVALSPEAIERRLADRLGLLTGGPRDRGPRQQTLRGALAWSYDLLEVPLQQLFRRLAVFSGSFTPAAVAAVCRVEPGAGGSGPSQAVDAVLDDLVHLTLANLVRRDADGPGADGEPRFRMLETIRAYAREQLEASGEAAEVQRRHAEYFVAHHRSAWVDAEQTQTRLAPTDEDNLRAALESVLRELVARGPEADPRRQAIALDSLGFLAYGRGDHAAARAWYRRSFALFETLRDSTGQALVLSHLGDVARAQEDTDQARHLYDQALALAPQDACGRLRALLGHVYLAAMTGDTQQAEALWQASRRLARSGAAPEDVAATLEARAVVEARRAGPEGAAPWLRLAEAVRLASGAGLAPVEQQLLERGLGAPLPGPDPSHAASGVDQAVRRALAELGA